MGLQSHLSDVSSESVLVLATVLVAKGVRYLLSLLFTIMRILRFCDRTDAVNVTNATLHRPPYEVAGSGLARLILLCDQISLNRAFSYPHGGDGGGECVVCLERLSRGDHARRLKCCHVFHRSCLEGWLEQLNFTCPVCRRALVAEERVGRTRARVSEDVLRWFAIQ